MNTLEIALHYHTVQRSGLQLMLVVCKAVLSMFRDDSEQSLELASTC